MLSQLGLADACFAGSFLLAQLRSTNSTSGGPSCQVAAVLNEFGGLTSAWWTVAMAWVLSCALLHRTSASFFSRRLFVKLALACWGVPLAIELTLAFTLYLPRSLLGPEASEPWCHWKHDVVALSVPQYANVVGAMAYCCYAYVRICRGFRAAARDALLLAAEQPALAAPLTPPRRSWSLDLRLASYLAAYLASQLPSVVHRVWQVASAGEAPRWLAVAQASTQPAQGVFNALVFLHHTRAHAACRPRDMCTRGILAGAWAGAAAGRRSTATSALGDDAASRSTR